MLVIWCHGLFVTVDARQHHSNQYFLSKHPFIRCLGRAAFGCGGMTGTGYLAIDSELQDGVYQVHTHIHRYEEQLERL